MATASLLGNAAATAIAAATKLSPKEMSQRLFGGRKYVLAPMVRCGTLPMRLACLKYGADTVFGPEIIDRKLMRCYREVNPRLGTVDIRMFTKDGGKGGVLVFRTKPSLERGRLVFQLGSSTPETAVAGAQLIADDVDGIDLNMGCPKDFSIKGGMGAALLKTPDIACDIVKALRTNFPNKCVSCKIRLLDTKEETIRLCQRLEAAGAHAISVHARTREERPRDPAHWDDLIPLVKCVSIPVLANGDIFSRQDAEECFRRTGVESVLVARGALLNPTMFDPSGKRLPIEDVCRDIIRFCIETDHHPVNCKYILQYMFKENGILGTERGRSLTSKKCRDLPTMAALFGLTAEDTGNFETVTVHSREHDIEKAKLAEKLRLATAKAEMTADDELPEKYSDDFHLTHGSDIPRDRVQKKKTPDSSRDPLIEVGEGPPPSKKSKQ
jgi:tRNA-dihydrouridine synthase 2